MTESKPKKQHRRTYRVEVRLNNVEYEKLKLYAESRQQPITETVRDWVKQLT